MSPWLRLRIPFVALALGTIALGLAVHWHGAVLGATMRDVLGDALYAMMVTWWVGAIAPAGSLRARGAAAFAICVAVETSQLVHTTTLDALRAMPGGNLVLGSDFDSRDLVAYLVGVVAAMALERLATRRTR